MRVVVIDFETFWRSKDYTLSRIGPVEYVRDPRFAVQLVGISVNGQPAQVYDRPTKETLKSLIDFDNDIIVGHNLAGFDALILSEHYGIRPQHMWDTIFAMRWVGLSSISGESHAALTALLGNGQKKAGVVVSDGKKWPDDFSPDEQRFFIRYCADDVNQCVANIKKMLPHLTADALQFMGITARMATEPVFILDEQLLDEFIRQLDAEAEDARQKIMEVFHFDSLPLFFKAIRSSQKFADMLRQLGVEPPTKYSAAKTASARQRLLDARAALRPEQVHAAAVLQESLSGLDRTGVSTYAFSKTDLDFLALREHDDPRVRLLVETRLEMNSSILRSRAETLLKFARHNRPVPVMLSAFKARTGRYSAGASEHSTDRMQFQNLSKRNPAHLPLRRAIRAPAGYKVVAVDSSQVEARVLAWEANHHELLDHFRQGRDPYAELAVNFDGQYTAAQIHNGAKSGDRRCKQLRNVAKTLILACLAGDTLVLTDSGWKRLDTITLEDRLWDGETWVRHHGLICNGWRTTTSLDGARMTRDHLIWNGTLWSSAGSLQNDPLLLSQALCIGGAALLMSSTGKRNPDTRSGVGIVARSTGRQRRRSSAAVQSIARIAQYLRTSVKNFLNSSILTPSLVQSSASSLLFGLTGAPCATIPRLLPVSWRCHVPAGEQDMRFSCTTSCPGELRDAPRALLKRAPRHGAPVMGVTPTSALTIPVAAGCSNTLGGVNRTGRLSSPLRETSSPILSRFPDGITLRWRWAGWTIRNLTLKATSVLFHTIRRCARGATGWFLRTCVIGLRKRTRTCERVFDIMNSGPNNRFLIKTDSGALLVHNCGYGTSAQKFSDTLLRQGMKLANDRAEHQKVATNYHAIYRASNSPIVRFWRVAQSVIEALVVGGAGQFGGPHGDLFEYGVMPIVGRQDLAVPSVRLPNGFCLRYPNLRVQDGENGRIEFVYDSRLGKNIVPRRLYGAGLVENLTQSLAFHILIWQACRMDSDGIALKGNNHDCWYTVVPDSQAQVTYDAMMRYMKQVPDWAAGCPIDCDGEIGDSFVVC